MSAELKLDFETREDYIMICHRQARSEASGKLCKPFHPRQPGELYPEYHRRIMEQLSQEAVACQQYVAARDMEAEMVADTLFEKDGLTRKDSEPK